MTEYELLKANESFLQLLHRNEINADDARYINVYEDLCRMEREGHKKTFIVAYLSQQYGVHEATLYRLAVRMKREVRF